MAIVEAVKEALKLARRLDNVPLDKQLLDVQSQALKIQGENQKLRSRLAELEDQLAFSQTLHFRNNAYWAQVDGSETGPFCSRCWDSDRKAIRLIDPKIASTFCPLCKVAVFTRG